MQHLNVMREELQQTTIKLGIFYYSADINSLYLL